MVRPIVGLAGILLLGATTGVRADGLIDAYTVGSSGPATIFPNWVAAPVGAFSLSICDDVVCAVPSAGIVGLTLVNLGTATGGAGGDITDVYFRVMCGAATDTGLLTMTWAGTYGATPAWTWNGVAGWGADPCATCACAPSVSIYVDAGACPVEGATIRLGLPPDAVTDAASYRAPIGTAAGTARTMRSVVTLADRTMASPGDTIAYTVYYGRPGAVDLSGVEIADTLPSFTHYIAGSAVPAPDAGWDPQLGPPRRLRWSVPGPLPVAGGATGEIRYALTVDWGDPLVPGSGPVAAPEGSVLAERATAAFAGTTCVPRSVLSGAASVEATRYRFWITADNDLLIAPAAGQPDDEVTYSLAITNPSARNTWRGIRVWETVPAQLDAAAPGCGLEDPCAGWTMTPSGCGIAAGRVYAGGGTILTWTLDVPPLATLALRWKGRLRNSVTAGATVITEASISAGTATGIRTAVHAAGVTPRSTWVGYASVGAAQSAAGVSPGFLLVFNPLNRQTTFELRGIEYRGGAFATGGGVSGTIGCRIGDCRVGFTGAPGCGLGSGSVSDGGSPGCGPALAPAVYDPLDWFNVEPPLPYRFVYKLVANLPVAMQLLSRPAGSADENAFFIPTSDGGVRGFVAYAWRRDDAPAPGTGYGDSLTIINTGLDANGVFDAARTTSVHLYRFDTASGAWVYRESRDLGAESQTTVLGTSAAAQEGGAWRIVSSNAAIMVYQSHNALDSLGCGAGCGDTFAAVAGFRENGNLVSPVGAGNAYILAHGDASPKAAGGRLVLTNVGGVDAGIRLWGYNPLGAAGPAAVPIGLRGSTGAWTLLSTATVVAGLASPGNPRIVGTGGGLPGGSTGLYKVELTAGGPIQVLAGNQVAHEASGGGVLHAVDGMPSGAEFWYSQTVPTSAADLDAFTVFCPQTGAAVRAESDDGYSATYTTTGPDQVVAFRALTPPGSGRRNWRLSRVGGGAGVLAMFDHAVNNERGYVAPMLRPGASYRLVAPATVFAGQSFWITVVVQDADGGVVTDYCGTTSFTSTDPSAVIEGTAMDAYDFGWSSSTGCSALPNEDGIRLFMNLSLNRTGRHVITGIDPTDGSISGVAAILVESTGIRLTKEPVLRVVSSGDTVQFRVAWSNYSSASAFTFTMTDAVPQGTTFVPEAGTWALNCGSTSGVGMTVAYSTAATVTPPFASSFITGNPAAATRWLRWTVPIAGVRTTGAACFRVVVQ